MIRIFKTYADGCTLFASALASRAEKLSNDVQYHRNTVQVVSR